MRSRERLRLSKQFLAIFRRGAWVRRPSWSIGTLPNRLAINRLGLRIRKGAGTAVERNRAKRLIRTAYRRISPALTTGQDLMIVVQHITHDSLADFEFELIDLCRRAHLERSNSAKPQAIP